MNKTKHVVPFLVLVSSLILGGCSGFDYVTASKVHSSSSSFETPVSPTPTSPASSSSEGTLSESSSSSSSTVLPVLAPRFEKPKGSWVDASIEIRNICPFPGFIFYDIDGVQQEKAAVTGWNGVVARVGVMKNTSVAFNAYFVAEDGRKSPSSSYLLTRESIISTTIDWEANTLNGAEFLYTRGPVSFRGSLLFQTEEATDYFHSDNIQIDYANSLEDKAPSEFLINPINFSGSKMVQNGKELIQCIDNLLVQKAAISYFYYRIRDVQLGLSSRWQLGTKVKPTVVTWLDSYNFKWNLVTTGPALGKSYGVHVPNADTTFSIQGLLPNANAAGLDAGQTLSTALYKDGKLIYPNGKTSSMTWTEDGDFLNGTFKEDGEWAATSPLITIKASVMDRRIQSTPFSEDSRSVNLPGAIHQLGFPKRSSGFSWLQYYIKITAENTNAVPVYVEWYCKAGGQKINDHLTIDAGASTEFGPTYGVKGISIGDKDTITWAVRQTLTTTFEGKTFTYTSPWAKIGTQYNTTTSTHYPDMATMTYSSELPF
jgi:hypothetical protein